MKKILFLLSIAVAQVVSAQTLSGNPELQDESTFGYLYTHRSDHGGWVAYAMSQDGIHFHDLLCGDSVLPAEVGGALEGNVPFVCRAQDGGFVMVSRSGSSNIMVYRSDDLIEWNRISTVAMPRNWKIGDPKLVWDSKTAGYLLYFPMSEGAKGTKLYGVRAGKDLKKWAKPQAVADWGMDVADVAIYPCADGGYVALFKNEDNADGIYVSKAADLAGGWSKPTVITPEEGKKVEAPAAFRLVGARDGSSDMCALMPLLTTDTVLRLQTKDLRRPDVLSTWRVCMAQTRDRSSVLMKLSTRSFRHGAMPRKRTILQRLSRILSSRDFTQIRRFSIASRPENITSTRLRTERMHGIISTSSASVPPTW